MGLMKKTNLMMAFALTALTLAFTACGGGGSNPTVANVPVNQCAQPGIGGAYPGGGAYPAAFNQFQPYAYNGSGCGTGGIPTCYQNYGGLACVPPNLYQNVWNQGYSPMFYGYNPGMNMYGYQGFYGWGSSYFQFTFNLGSGGYYPNRYVQGCNVNSFMNSCGFGGICRPLGVGNGVGICVRRF